VPGLSRDKVRAIADRLTISDDVTLRGRVNINTAPASVLAALPGMNAQIAEEIVNYRSSSPFTSVGDLLQISSVTNTVFSQVADSITVRSFTYRIRAQGVLPNSRIVKHIEAVVVLQPIPMDEQQANAQNPQNPQAAQNPPQTSTEPQIPFIETRPRIVYWREW
jgi:competence ComEA-like helix-hairpin-helix protein